MASNSKCALIQKNKYTIYSTIRFLLASRQKSAQLCYAYCIMQELASSVDTEFMQAHLPLMCYQILVSLDSCLDNRDSRVDECIEALMRTIVQHNFVKQVYGPHHHQCHKCPILDGTDHASKGDFRCKIAPFVGRPIPKCPPNGEVVEVDFNCLFNKGEELPLPECVPFRLTHNMVAAMGLVGFDGLFRHSCEDILLVLRQFGQLFAHKVKTFQQEPWVDWRKTDWTKGDWSKPIRPTQEKVSA